MERIHIHIFECCFRIKQSHFVKCVKIRTFLLFCVLLRKAPSCMYDEGFLHLCPRKHFHFIDAVRLIALRVLISNETFGSSPSEVVFYIGFLKTHSKFREHPCRIEISINLTSSCWKVFLKMSVLKSVVKILEKYL